MPGNAASARPKANRPLIIFQMPLLFIRRAYVLMVYAENLMTPNIIVKHIHSFLRFWNGADEPILLWIAMRGEVNCEDLGVDLWRIRAESYCSRLGLWRRLGLEGRRERRPRGFAHGRQERRVFLLISCLIRLIHLLSLNWEDYLTPK
jgi:hypothetical protein